MNETSPQPAEGEPQLRCLHLSIRSRVVLWLYGFVMPLICFAIATATDAYFVDQPWQSGETSMYAAMLLRPRAWLPFAPWLLISLCSFAWWTYQPNAARKLWVRFGLYSGVVLAFQFWSIILFSHGVISLIAAAFVLPTIFALSLFIASIAAHYKRFQIWHLLVLTTVVAVFAAATQVMPSYVLSTALAAPLFALAAAPTLNLIAYIRAASIVGQTDSSRPDPLRWLWAMFAAWTLGWLVSWRFAVQAMLDEYSRLPVSNPNCYFANAAACAHAWLGGQRREREAPRAPGSACSTPLSATLAMKRLKFLELVLSATAPRLQRLVRRYYDRWGEPAAEYCRQHPWFADLTCLALKPVEGVAEIVRIAAGVAPNRLSEIYRREPE